MKTEYQLILSTLEWLEGQTCQGSEEDFKREKKKLDYCQRNCTPSKCFDCGVEPKTQQKGKP